MSANYEPDYIRDLAEVVWGAVEHGDPRGAEAKLREALATSFEKGYNRGAEDHCDISSSNPYKETK